MAKPPTTHSEDEDASVGELWLEIPIPNDESQDDGSCTEGSDESEDDDSNGYAEYAAHKYHHFTKDPAEDELNLTLPRKKRKRRIISEVVIDIDGPHVKVSRTRRVSALTRQHRYMYIRSSPIPFGDAQRLQQLQPPSQPPVSLPAAHENSATQRASIPTGVRGSVREIGKRLSSMIRGWFSGHLFPKQSQQRVSNYMVDVSSSAAPSKRGESRRTTNTSGDMKNKAISGLADRIRKMTALRRTVKVGSLSTGKATQAELAAQDTLALIKHARGCHEVLTSVNTKNQGLSRLIDQLAAAAYDYQKELLRSAQRRLKRRSRVGTARRLKKSTTPQNRRPAIMNLRAKRRTAAGFSDIFSDKSPGDSQIELASVFGLKMTDKARQWCFKVLIARWWDFFILSCFALDLLCVLTQNPFDLQRRFAINAIFLFFLTVKICLEVVSLGLLGEKGGFFRRADEMPFFAAYLVSVVELVLACIVYNFASRLSLEGEDLHRMSLMDWKERAADTDESHDALWRTILMLSPVWMSFRVLLNWRPFMLSIYIPHTRMIVACVGTSTAQLWKVLLLSLMMFVVFGIIGIHMFSGLLLHRCKATTSYELTPNGFTPLGTINFPAIFDLPPIRVTVEDGEWTTVVDRDSEIADDFVWRSLQMAPDFSLFEMLCAITDAANETLTGKGRVRMKGPVKNEETNTSEVMMFLRESSSFLNNIRFPDPFLAAEQAAADIAAEASFYYPQSLDQFATLNAGIWLSRGRMFAYNGTETEQLPSPMSRFFVEHEAPPHMDDLRGTTSFPPLQMGLWAEVSFELHTPAEMLRRATPMNQTMSRAGTQQLCNNLTTTPFFVVRAVAQLHAFDQHSAAKQLSEEIAQSWFVFNARDYCDSSSAGSSSPLPYETSRMWRLRTSVTLFHNQTVSVGGHLSTYGGASSPGFRKFLTPVHEKDLFKLLRAGAAFSVFSERRLASTTASFVWFFPLSGVLAEIQMALLGFVTSFEALQHRISSILVNRLSNVTVTGEEETGGGASKFVQLGITTRGGVPAFANNVTTATWDVEHVCSGKMSAIRRSSCEATQRCMWYGINPNGGLIGMDQIADAWLTLFVFISLENWRDILQWYEDGAGNPAIYLYFIPLYLIAFFFIITSIAATVFVTYAENNRAMIHEAKRNHKLREELVQRELARLRDTDGRRKPAFFGIFNKEPVAKTDKIATRQREKSIDAFALLSSSNTQTLKGHSPDDDVVEGIRLQTKLDAARRDIAEKSNEELRGQLEGIQSHLNRDFVSARTEGDYERLRTRLKILEDIIDIARFRLALLDARAWSYSGFRRFLFALISHPIFEALDIASAFAHVICLGIYNYEQPRSFIESLEEVVSFAELEFYFVTLMRLSALRLTIFKRPWVDKLDVLLVIPIGVYRPMGVFRILRVYYWLLENFRRLSALKDLLTDLGAALKGLAALIVVMVLNLVCSGVLGTALFRNMFSPSVRSHFNTTGFSFLTVFQVLTEEDWPEIMYEAIAARGSAAVLYFVFLLAFNNWLLLYIFLAILIEHYYARRTAGTIPAKESIETENELTGGKKTETGIPSRFQTLLYWDPLTLRQIKRLKSCTDKDLGKYPSAPAASLGISVHTTTRPPRRSNRNGASLYGLPAEAAMSIDDTGMKEEAKPWSGSANNQPAVISLQTAVSESAGDAPQRRRQKARMLVSSRWYWRLYYITLLLHVIVAASDANHSEGFFALWAMQYLYAAADTLFVPFFTVDIGVKVWIYGMWKEPDSYFRSGFNIFDAVMTLIAWVDLITCYYVTFAIVPTASIFADSSHDVAAEEISAMQEKIGLGWLRFAHVVVGARGMRPFRMIRHLDGLRKATSCVLISLRKTGNILLLVLMTYLLFILLGLHFFIGRFGECAIGVSDKGLLSLLGDDFTPTNPLEGLTPDDLVDKDQCERYGGEWVHHWPNFNSFFGAASAMFEVAFLESWTDIMYRAIDIEGYNKGPKHEANPFASLFFVLFIWLGVFIVLNLLASVMIDQYQAQREKRAHRNRLRVLMTVKQRRWYKTMEHLLMPNEDKWRDVLLGSVAWWGRYVFSDAFGAFMAVLVTVHISVLSSFHLGQEEGTTEQQFRLHYLFTVIYFVEIALKWSSAGTKAFFRPASEKLCVILALLCYVGIQLEQFGVPYYFRCLGAFCCLRIITFLGELAFLRSVRSILSALLLVLPSVGNFALLIFLIYCAAAISAMNMFGSIRDGDFIDEKFNFSNFQRSLLVLT
ncbi:unnamed protein product [Vitrella brassicaformis CCMP3155]|uniref:Ion transport domain-containing protein n=5 Tax=Vitrella brassicaformis TaxID=1169539 RepID=A0A0G4H4M7_VITBC|nr:unnamed protein product [Vitrella brassicaformis CCMP3155]|eukprot:CEM38610.1 unnamed protein product [Vitrella brassicaformis CCMP3155]